MLIWVRSRFPVDETVRVPARERSQLVESGTRAPLRCDMSKCARYDVVPVAIVARTDRRPRAGRRSDG